MTPEDAAALFAAAYRHQAPWDSAAIAATLATKGARLFASPGGVLIARILGDEAEILALATDPAQQRSGVATALLAQFHEAAAQAGARTAFLEVAERNAPARALYARAGYAEIGRRPGYYRLPDGARDAAIVLQRARAAKLP